MFKALGLLLGLYVAYATLQGKVYAKDGVRGKTISRSESPRAFWTVVLIYACLALALLMVF